MMKIINEWWKTIKDHEGMFQILGKDPAGNVSERCILDDSTEQLTIPLIGLHHTFHVL
jgi:hypothetical protein